MKITDILKLAMKNLTGHKRIMLRVAVSVLTVVLLCCSAAVFVSAVTDELSDIQYKHIDQACAMVSAYSDTAKQAGDTADDIISKITAVSEVISCNVGYRYDIYTTSEYLNSISQSNYSEDHLVKDITGTRYTEILKNAKRKRTKPRPLFWAALPLRLTK